MSIPMDIPNKQDSFQQRKVFSIDGTRIGYRSIGEGPGIILVHGALRDSEDYTCLAIALSRSFTVHLMDRRGRGLSGPQGPGYAMNKECEDVQAIRVATGADYLIGHSFGGLVSLELARIDASITKVALYEPGVLINPMDEAWMRSYEKAMQKNDRRGAFAHFVKGMGQTPLTQLPYWYAKLILRIMIRGHHWTKTAHLLPQNLCEHREVQRLASSYRNYNSIKADVILIQGDKSSDSTKEMMEQLNRTITRSKVETMNKLDHFGPENSGGPDRIAGLLTHFFLNRKGV
ncbi:alpha/beta fold hydrolase [Paenibacillus sacheonensis]|uniref:Alpha/beta fold hydrolase n=1 Tax=Paenibacillus sacheonensis TaxID=742054 RepID=A0A7X5C1Q9_9BACL|nr:alpha/beta hydrolase [Paenibacillus sacheonensis]MBM7569182.1 pimeloyl-ACP methyl ester carboxylesterase [Paenibacillus sacheonensis]NBC73007.1 alpha/beta fold hydrolase [Paenibacillus sacheonensis]